MNRLMMILAFALTLQLPAQVLFTAEASKYKVGVGERFTVTFSINSDAGNFTYPSFTGFTVVGGPFTQFSTSIINGRASVQKAARFDLMAVKQGTYTIGAAKVSAGNETYTTKPLTIEVTESAQVQPGSLEDMAAQLAYVKILTSRQSIYVGEAIPVRYTLFLKTDISGYNAIQEPDLQGFMRRDIEIGQATKKREVINGEQVTTADVAQYILLAQRPGTFKPGKLLMQLPTLISTGNRDWFGRLEYTTVNQVSTANFPTIEVKPLPEAGKPEGFGGAVGDYKMYVSLSRKEVKANESITLSIEVSGSGNLQLSEIPRPELPASIESYDPKFKENFNVNLSGIKGSKRYEYLLIPRYKGTYKIPALAFHYFDPAKGKYQTLSSEELVITVTDGPVSTGTTPSPAANAEDKTAVSALNEDILFIHTHPSPFEKDAQTLYENKWHDIAVIAFLIGAVIILAFGQIRRLYKPDAALVARKTAGTRSKKQLKQAAKHLQNNDYKLFYAEIQLVIQRYFQFKFGIQPADFGTDTIVETILKKGGSEDLAREVSALITQANMARFAGMSEENMKHDFEKTEKCIEKLEALS